MSSKTGISDEAAMGEHDLIHQAELEEQKVNTMQFISPSSRDIVADIP